jgi:hypothetical protein
VINKYIKQLVLVTLVIGLFPTLTYAADIEVTCADKSGCVAKPTGIPLFSEHNIKPLWSVTKTVKVTSKYNEPRQLLVDITDIPFDSFDKSKSLAKVLNIAIKEVESGKTTWSGTLTALNDKGSLKLTSIPKNSSRNYSFTVTLSNVGNDYQSKQAKFDMFLGFKTDKEPKDEHGNPGGGGQNQPPEVRGRYDIRGFFNKCSNFFHNLFSKFSGHNK